MGDLRSVAAGGGSDGGRSVACRRLLLAGSGTGDLNGRVLNRGEYSSVALGDGSGRVRWNADGGLGGGELRSLSRVGRCLTGDPGSGGNPTSRGDPGLSGLRDGANSGRNSDRLGRDDGGISRAVGHLLRTLSDGNNLAGVDSRGGEGKGGG